MLDDSLVSKWVEYTSDRGQLSKVKEELKLDSSVVYKLVKYDSDKRSWIR